MLSANEHNGFQHSDSNCSGFTVGHGEKFLPLAEPLLPSSGGRLPLPLLPVELEEAFDMIFDAAARMPPGGNIPPAHTYAAASAIPKPPVLPNLLFPPFLEEDPCDMLDCPPPPLLSPTIDIAPGTVQANNVSTTALYSTGRDRTSTSRTILGVLFDLATPDAVLEDGPSVTGVVGREGDELVDWFFSSR